MLKIWNQNRQTRGLTTDSYSTNPYSSMHCAVLSRFYDGSAVE